jgi:hypothetical protein
VAKKISWNEAALEQRADELDPEDVICRECETAPQLKMFGRYWCDCGKLEGAVSDQGEERAAARTSSEHESRAGNFVVAPVGSRGGLRHLRQFPHAVTQ